MELRRARLPGDVSIGSVPTDPVDTHLLLSTAESVPTDLTASLDSTFDRALVDPGKRTSFPSLSFGFRRQGAVQDRTLSED